MNLHVRGLKPSRTNLRVWQFSVLVLMLLIWQLASRDQQMAFFLGEPVQVLGRIWSWFMPFGLGASVFFPEGVAGNADIYIHLGVTLLETVLALLDGFDHLAVRDAVGRQLVGLQHDLVLA